MIVQRKCELLAKVTNLVEKTFHKLCHATENSNYPFHVDRDSRSVTMRVWRRKNIYFLQIREQSSCNENSFVNINKNLRQIKLQHRLKSLYKRIKHY